MTPSAGAPAVLIVDDESELVEILSHTLQNAGYTTHPADSVKTALEILAAHPIDVVLTDMRMPGATGIDLIRAIREKDPEKPAVILMTSEAAFLPSHITNLGVDDLLPKPIGKEVLLASIKRMLIPKKIRYQRRFDRKNANITVKVASAGLDQTHAMSTDNLSVGGMFIKMASELPGQNESIEFTIPPQEDVVEEIKGKATVRWHRQTNSVEKPRGAGVEFLSPSPELLALIRRMLG